METSYLSSLISEVPINLFSYGALAKLRHNCRCFGADAEEQSLYNPIWSYILSTFYYIIFKTTTVILKLLLLDLLDLYPKMQIY